MRRDWLKLLALLVPVLTGCLSHTRKLQQPKLAGVALNADAVQLVEAVNRRYDQVNFAERDRGFCGVGGWRPQRPGDRLHLHSRLHSFAQAADAAGAGATCRSCALRAFDLASDGKTFTLLIPPRSRAIQGSNSVTTPTANPLENLRPDILSRFHPDSQYLSGPNRIPDQLQPDHGGPANQAADRDAAVRPDGIETRASGVPPGTAAGGPGRCGSSHFNRVNLMPTEQDIYNNGRRSGDSGDLRAVPDFSGIPVPQHHHHQPVAGRISALRLRWRRSP